MFHSLIRLLFFVVFTAVFTILLLLLSFLLSQFSVSKFLLLITSSISFENASISLLIFFFHYNSSFLFYLFNHLCDPIPPVFSFNLCHLSFSTTQIFDLQVIIFQTNALPCPYLCVFVIYALQVTNLRLILLLIFSSTLESLIFTKRLSQKYD